MIPSQIHYYDNKYTQYKIKYRYWVYGRLCQTTVFAVNHFSLAIVYYWVQIEHIHYNLQLLKNVVHLTSTMQHSSYISWSLQRTYQACQYKPRYVIGNYPTPRSSNSQLINNS